MLQCSFTDQHYHRNVLPQFSSAVLLPNSIDIAM